MRVLVTGGCGFVGSHIIEALLERGGISPIALDDLSTGDVSNIDQDRVALIHNDVRQYRPPSFGPCSTPFHAIVHAAAAPGIRDDWDSEAHLERQFKNIRITRDVAELAARYKVPLVFTSSASVYGSQPYGEILEREATPQDIESPYAACKMSAEAILQAYQRKHHFPLLILRLVNQVGARMRRGVIADFVSMAKTPWCEACGCYVQHPRLNSHFVHCCDRCLRPLRFLRSGHIQARDDGTQRKDWCHVKDTADVVVRYLLRQEKPETLTLNMSGDQQLGWPDIVELMSDIHPVNVTPGKDRSGWLGDPYNLTVNTSLLQLHFPFKPRNVKIGVYEALDSLGWSK